MKKLLLLFVLLAGCTITGNVVFGGQNMHLQESRVTETSAEIIWTTNSTSDATFILDDIVLVFNDSQSFTASVQNLQPGKRYSYTIIACNAEEKCENYYGSFKTAENGAGAITAAAIRIPAVPLSSGSLSAVLFVIILVVIIVAVVRIAPNIEPLQPLQLSDTIRMAEHHAKQGNHEQALAHYKTAHQLYEKLDEAKQLKHYPKLLALYRSLSMRNKAAEASVLVDKYAEGSITGEELERLRELLTE